ncbi:MAG: hypothetical protein LBD02_01520 [Christensenellaceae bacterium]|jgi:PHD/YefM family antitoxin component YafN of YafNO toxin-antitoxin module|nr:hypothetical protein [Christensenellaceae bacterium]
MKNVSLDEFSAGLPGIVWDVMAAGDIVCVDTGEAGRFVVMEEAEYNVLREAAALVLGAASE